jgi:nucleotide-binding universal stress UspA family protein
VGDPADELATQASDLDLLVIGSRGYGPLRSVLLGGVSAKVMRSAPCPVFVVPRASTEDFAPGIEASPRRASSQR